MGRNYGHTGQGQHTLDHGWHQQHQTRRNSPAMRQQTSQNDQHSRQEQYPIHHPPDPPIIQEHRKRYKLLQQRNYPIQLQAGWKTWHHQHGTPRDRQKHDSTRRNSPNWQRLHHPRPRNHWKMQKHQQVPRETSHENRNISHCHSKQRPSWTPGPHTENNTTNRHRFRDFQHRQDQSRKNHRKKMNQHTQEQHPSRNSKNRN